MSNGYHALASPSGSVKVLGCANSLAMEKGEERTSSAAADLGTDKHELMTQCLGDDGDAAASIGTKMGKGNLVDKAFADEVQKVVDSVRARIANYRAAGFTVEMHLAQDLPIEHITGEEGATGEGDVLLVVTRPSMSALLDVIDAKFGYQEVSPETPQLRMYGSGALELFGLTEDFGEVNMVIEQPLRGASEPFTQRPDEIAIWVAEARPKFEKALTIYRLVDERALKDEDFAPSEETCMWCLAKGRCPAQLGLVEKTLEAEFGDGLTDVPPVEKVSNERLAEIFPHLEFVEDWIKAVRARIEAEAFAGRAVPGTKVVAGKRGNRAWQSEDEAEAMMKKFKLKQDQMYALALRGPKPILDLLKDQPRRLKQIEMLVVQGEGKPHVVSDTDPRPAIEITPVEDGFDVIDDLC